MPPQLVHDTYLWVCTPDHSILKEMAITSEATL